MHLATHLFACELFSLSFIHPSLVPRSTCTHPGPLSASAPIHPFNSHYPSHPLILPPTHKPHPSLHSPSHHPQNKTKGHLGLLSQPGLATGQRRRPPAGHAHRQKVRLAFPLSPTPLHPLNPPNHPPTVPTVSTSRPKATSSSFFIQTSWPTRYCPTSAKTRTPTATPTPFGSWGKRKRRRT